MASIVGMPSGVKPHEAHDVEKLLGTHVYVQRSGTLVCRHCARYPYDVLHWTI